MGSSVDLTEFAIKIPSEDAEFQRDSVADLLKRRNKHFPGAQPVSFARRHLEELRNRDYFMCEKTDGLRCLLFLTQTINDANEPQEALFIIDRRNDYFYVQTDAVHVPTPSGLASFHRGTLLDGELVRQRDKSTGKSRLAYLIFDSLAMEGENITGKPFDKRLARIEQRVSNPLRQMAKDYPQDVAAQPFQIEMKKMELPYGAEMMFKDRIPNLPHGNDGLIFTCKGTPYVAGTDPHILKWKPPHENTIDLRLILAGFPMLEDEDGQYEDWDAKPVTELWVNHGRDGYRFFAHLTLTEDEWEAFKSTNVMVDGRILECFRDPEAGTWRPKLEEDGTPRFRDDKQDANHISVVDSVLESIKDAVTENDLIAEAGAIRAPFKARQAEEARRMKEEEMMARRRHDEAKRAKQQQAQAAAQEEQRRKAAEAETEDDDAGPGYD